MLLSFSYLLSREHRKDCAEVHQFIKVPAFEIFDCPHGRPFSFIAKHVSQNTLWRYYANMEIFWSSKETIFPDIKYPQAG